MNDVVERIRALAWTKQERAEETRKLKERHLRDWEERMFDRYAPVLEVAEKFSAAYPELCVAYRRDSLGQLLMGLKLREPFTYMGHQVKDIVWGREAEPAYALMSAGLPKSPVLANSYSIPTLVDALVDLLACILASHEDQKCGNTPLTEQ